MPRERIRDPKKEISVTLRPGVSDFVRERGCYEREKKKKKKPEKGNSPTLFVPLPRISLKKRRKKVPIH